MIFLSILQERINELQSVFFHLTKLQFSTTYLSCTDFVKNKKIFITKIIFFSMLNRNGYIKLWCRSITACDKSPKKYNFISSLQLPHFVMTSSNFWWKKSFRVKATEKYLSGIVSSLRAFLIRDWKINFGVTRIRLKWTEPVTPWQSHVKRKYHRWHRKKEIILPG